jgi:glycosyltransferase involved in cell wall biosynthesis
VSARNPAIRLHIAGSHTPDAIRGLASDQIVVHGWVAKLEPLLEQMRLGIAPLRFGAGFKGKVATYMTYGLPVVGTGMALEGTGLAHDDGVALADSAEEFADAIMRLHDNEAAWTEMSFRALERCETLYSEEAGRAVLARMLESAGLVVRQAP